MPKFLLLQSDRRELQARLHPKPGHFITVPTPCFLAVLRVKATVEMEI